MGDRKAYLDFGVKEYKSKGAELIKYLNILKQEPAKWVLSRLRFSIGR